ncbi:MAG: hypothetical protein JNM63_16625 [Spirochaetia bacterium]|nr:hypothetical protein [Spirochaetia bacterium]
MLSNRPNFLQAFVSTKWVLLSPFGVLLVFLASCTTIQYGVDDVPTYKELRKATQVFKIGTFLDATLSQTNQTYAGAKKYVEMDSVLYEYNDKKKYLFGISYEFGDIFKDHMTAAGLRIWSQPSSLVISGTVSNFESYVEFNPDYDRKVKNARLFGAIVFSAPLRAIVSGVGTRIAEEEAKGFPLRQINIVGFSVQVMQKDNPIFEKYYSLCETNSVKYLDNEDSGVYPYVNEAMKKLVNQFAADLKELVSFLQ